MTEICLTVCSDPHIMSHIVLRGHLLCTYPVYQIDIFVHNFFQRKELKNVFTLCIYCFGVVYAMHIRLCFHGHHEEG